MHLFRSKRILGLFLSAALILSASFTTVSAADQPRRLIPPASGSSSGSSSSSGKTTSSKGSISVKKLKEVAKDYNVPDEFLKAVSKKSSITPRQLQQYGDQYQLPAQYVQRFITTHFVFKAGNKLQYIPVDSKLAKNNYDFDNIVHTSKEIKYVVNGKSKALKGIDVSEYQGNIDWNKVKADGVKFAFIRVGYRGYGTGKLFLDKNYEQNLKGAIKAGIPVGVYFYSQATTTKEAKEEAQLVLDAIDGYKITYPVVIDLEDAPSSRARTSNLSSQTVTNIAKAFCSEVKSKGYKPMIYTNSKWFIERMDMSQLTSYDKWLAQYYQVPFFPYKFNIWQYTGKGRVNGIQGDVDMNLCFTSYK